MIKKIALSILLAGTAGTVMAAPAQDVTRNDGGFFQSIVSYFHPAPPRGGENGPFAAPEMDPASAISGLTLLIGGIAVVAAGRRRKPLQAA